MLLAHEHSVVGHHLQSIPGEGGAAEESAARVDTLMILRDQDINVLYSVVFGGVDVGGVRLELAVENGRVAHQPALDSFRADNFLDQVVVWLHYNNVGVNEPDPFGGWVEVKCFGDSRDLGPGLQHMSVCSLNKQFRNPATYPVRVANVIAAGVQPKIGVAMPGAVFLAVVQYALQDIGDCAVVTSAVTSSQDDDVAVPRISSISIPPSIVWHLPIPLWLCLEVTGLRLVILCWGCHNGFSRCIVPVVVHRHIAKESREDDQYCNN